MSARVVHFELPYDDAERARGFYSSVFDWQVVPMEEMSYTMVTTGPSGERGPTDAGYINGGMFERTADVASPCIVLDVPDIDAALAAVQAAGGAQVTGREPVGDMGFAAYFTDTEGNLVGLWETARSGGLLSNDPLVRYDVAAGAAVLTLDSPHNRNALSRRLVGELLDRLDEAEQDDAARVVVVRAAGPVFCSGADLAEAAEGSMREGAAALVEVQRRILACPKPVLARVDGPVRAGGTGIVAACDLAVAAESATFALTEVRLGLAPAVVSLTVLPRLTSRAAARVFLTGEVFDGAAAAAMGLVTVAVTAERVEQEVARLVSDLAAGHPQGLRESKRLLNAPVLETLERDGERLADLSGRLFGSDEARAAMAAFLSRSRGTRP